MVTEKQKANLILNSQRTQSELREITRKGGIKSGEARREKKNLKQTIQCILDMKIASKEEREQICRNLGLPAKDVANMTHRVAISAKMIRQAEMGMHQQQKMIGEMDDSFTNTASDKQVFEINLNVQNNKIAHLVDEMTDE